MEFTGGPVCSSLEGWEYIISLAADGVIGFRAHPSTLTPLEMTSISGEMRESGSAKRVEVRAPEGVVLARYGWQCLV